MKVLDIVPLTPDNTDEPLLNTVFDDVNGIEELTKYTQYEYVEQALDSFESEPSAFLRKVYGKQIENFSGSEKEFWINEIIQEASFYLREVWKWINLGHRSDVLIRSLADLKQYPNVLDSTAYLLKGKAWHLSNAPLLRVYFLQIGTESEEPFWILLFEGIKLEYQISNCPGIVASLFERTKLVIDKLKGT